MSYRGTTKSNESIVHCFEEAGLGKAPFAYEGCEDTAAEAGPDGMVPIKGMPGAFTKPGGTCDYCGHYIVVFCWIRSADGNRFKVGTDCVEKTGDKGLINRVKREVNKRRTEKRHAREAARIAACREYLERDDVRAELRKEAHPVDWCAEKGDTREDWADWMMRCSGNRGRLQVARFVESVVKKIKSTTSKVESIQETAPLESYPRSTTLAQQMPLF